MSIFQAGIDKAHARQSQAIIEEAGQAGTAVVNVFELGGNESSAAASVIGSSLTNLFGGNVRCEYAQVFQQKLVVPTTSTCSRMTA